MRARNDDLKLDYAPARFVWLGRFVFGVLFVILLLLIWRGVLVIRHASVSASAARGLRELGIPTIDELNARPKLPDDRNAAILYLKAGDLFDDDHTAYRNSNYDFPHRAKYPILWYCLAAGSDERYQAMFELAHEAGTLPEAQWSDPIVGLKQVNKLYELRALAAELSDNAEYHHLLGNDRIALERIEDTLRLGRAIRQDPRMISQLVGNGITALSHSVIGRISAGLRVEDAEVAAQVRRLIAELERDEAEIEQSAFGSLSVELAEVDTAAPLLFGEPWCTRSLSDSRATRARREIASVARDWFAPARPVPEPTPKAKPRQPPNPLAFVRRQVEPALGFEFDGNIVPLVPSTEPAVSWVDSFESSYARYRDTVRKSVAECRLVRVALAIRLYRHDHGRFPAAVSDLVPAYLASVPLSPWDANRSVGFTVLRASRPDGGDRPMIYLDGFSSANAAPDYYSHDFHNLPGSDRAGRQWRDVSVWPDSAYQATDNDKPSGLNAPIDWPQPGFEASGLEPSEHSPRPEQDPGIPEQPRNAQEPEAPIE